MAGSNNFQGPVILTELDSYFAWGRQGPGVSSHVRVYRVDYDPNGVLAAPRGSWALRDDAGQVAAYLNQDGASTWAKLVPNGGGTAGLVMPLEKELLPLGGDDITDSVRVNAAGTIVEVLFYCSVAYTTAGSFTIDVQLNSVSVLSAVVDGTTIPALPGVLTAPLAASTPLAAGDVLSVVLSSDNADLAGAGLTAVFRTEA
jgi:hypothetical protein